MMGCANKTDLNCDEIYALYVPIMYVYVLSFLLLIGFSGNFLSLIVFEIQRRRRKGPATLSLLICLAVSDNLYLLSNIFSRLLPTLSQYIFLGEQLLWAMEIKPYSTVCAGICQAFSACMLGIVTLHRYLIITRPIRANIWMSTKKVACLVIAAFLISIVLHIPRFFELHIVWDCVKCLGDGGVYLPTQVRTDLGEHIYFQIIYNIIIKSGIIMMVPIVLVVVLTTKLVQVSGNILFILLSMINVSKIILLDFMELA